MHQRMIFMSIIHKDEELSSPDLPSVSFRTLGGLENHIFWDINLWD